MPNPIFITPLKRVGRKLKERRTAESPPVETLELVAATYQEGASVTLTFNQAIDISAFNGDAVFLDDTTYTLRQYIAVGGASLLSPTTMRAMLVDFEQSQSQAVTLTAPASTGIVAVNGDGTWSGVSNLYLPFPS